MNFRKGLLWVTGLLLGAGGAGAHHAGGLHLLTECLRSKAKDRLDRHFLACLPPHAHHKSVRLTAPAGVGTIYRGMQSYPGKYTVRIQGQRTSARRCCSFCFLVSNLPSLRSWSSLALRFSFLSRVFSAFASSIAFSLRIRNCPFSVLGFWDKRTMARAGTMACHRDLLATSLCCGSDLSVVCVVLCYLASSASSSALIRANSAASAASICCCFILCMSIGRTFLRHKSRVEGGRGGGRFRGGRRHPPHKTQHGCVFMKP